MARRNNGGSSAAPRQPGIQPQSTGGDNSLILRTAESLGRMIGALQRQLETVADQAKPAAGTSTRATANRKTTNRKTANRKIATRKITNTKVTKPAKATRAKTKRAKTKRTTRR